MKERLNTLFVTLLFVFVALLLVGSLITYAYGDPVAIGGGYSATDMIVQVQQQHKNGSALGNRENTAKRGQHGT